MLTKLNKQLEKRGFWDLQNWSNIIIFEILCYNNSDLYHDYLVFFIKV